MFCEKHQHAYVNVCSECVTELQRANQLANGNKWDPASEKFPLLSADYAALEARVMMHDPLPLKYYGTTKGRSRSYGALAENLPKPEFMATHPSRFNDPIPFDAKYYALGISTCLGIEGSVVDDIVNSMLPAKAVIETTRDFWNTGTSTVAAHVPTKPPRPVEEIINEMTAVLCDMGVRKYRTCLTCGNKFVARTCHCIGEHP